MTHASGKCPFPDLPHEFPEDDILISPERRQAAEEKRIYSLCIDLLAACPGSCAYCYASSDEASKYILPKEVVLRLIDEAKEIGMKEVMLCGGDPILHPNWYELGASVRDKGLDLVCLPSGILNKKQAKQLFELGTILVGTNIETLDQEAYNKVHTNPKTLEARIKGHYYLLEAGFKPEQILPQMTLTRPVMPTVEKAIDWMVDELGLTSICMPTFRAIGFGKERKDLEPSLSDLRRVHEYRAQKLGKHWLRIGTSDATKFICITYICISPKGNVELCPAFPDYTVGNIYEESLKDICQKHKKELLFDFEVKGACSTCFNSDVCFGCRSTAFAYTGDIHASDPKCFLNPEAPEFVFPQDG